MCRGWHGWGPGVAVLTVILALCSTRLYSSSSSAHRSPRRARCPQHVPHTILPTPPLTLPTSPSGSAAKAFLKTTSPTQTITLSPPPPPFLPLAHIPSAPLHPPHRLLSQLLQSLLISTPPRFTLHLVLRARPLTTATATHTHIPAASPAMTPTSRLFLL